MVYRRQKLNIHQVPKSYIGKNIKIWYHFAIIAKIELSFRRKDGWDDWTTPVKMDKEQTHEAFSTCFYRKYDITIERGQLYSCSRIAKDSTSSSGLKIHQDLELDDIKNFLNTDQPFQECYKCSPVAGLPKVPVAEQTINNLEKKIFAALTDLQGGC